MYSKYVPTQPDRLVGALLVNRMEGPSPRQFAGSCVPAMLAHGTCNVSAGGRACSWVLQTEHVLILLEVAAIVGRQSHSSFDREFLHQVHGMCNV